ncbi:tumor necrosis factor receptor superfamily member 1B-like isoform X2 [Acanthaster planci]|uniref:Tumor necrosis factor receptor superfamily member 1B-like isoform X2 n=1 Tax=Acanthaster planci TaxID=133434 RepID=A0A8B7YAE3_ACAPL|nr:tumor necrosis factor receptor superfamily member 1B-like isoform X2 [Acanthaster planci]XP_022090219.1 tumor necrosis factor receptor superfamily member 1B-like isoform X2 [Acanthaster planci]
MDQQNLSAILMLLFLHQAYCSEVKSLTSDASVFPQVLGHVIKPRSTSSKFIPGPDGERCILDANHIQDRRYEKEDDRGGCYCELCDFGKYAKQLCQCGGPNGTQANVTDCKFVKEGLEYMDKANKCSQPYNCSLSCGNHQFKVANCTAMSDIKCECEEGWFNPHPSKGETIPRECRVKPRCPAGQGLESHTIASTGEVSFTCQPCRDGYFQGFDNSISSCQPHRACTVQAGNSINDNICLNDDLPMNLSSNVPGEPSTLEPKELESTTGTTPTQTQPSGEPRSTQENLPDDEVQPGVWYPAGCIIALACTSCVILVVLVSYCVYIKCKKKETYMDLPTVDYNARQQQVQLHVPTGT